MKIGPVEIAAPFILAPMAGYTHYAFRRLCRELGAGMVYTELVSVEGIVRRAPTTLHLLETGPDERPVAAHLYGKNPDAFARAAAYVTERGGFDTIDINAGCPVPKIVRRGEGAGLIKTPEKLAEIIRAVRGATTLPVTVKTRMGASARHFNALELLRVAEESGAAALALHARFTENRHSGPADWNILAQVKAAARIPIIGNGGVTTAQQAWAMLKETGVDAVMIGRATMGNPWIFRQMLQFGAGETPAEPTPAERRELMARHLAGLVDSMRVLAALRRRAIHPPEETAVRQFRAHLVHYCAGRPGVNDLKRKLNGLRTVEETLAAAALVA